MILYADCLILVTAKFQVIKNYYLVLQEEGSLSQVTKQACMFTYAVAQIRIIVFTTMFLAKALDKLDQTGL